MGSIAPRSTLQVEPSLYSRTTPPPRGGFVRFQALAPVVEGIGVGLAPSGKGESLLLEAQGYSPYVAEAFSQTFRVIGGPIHQRVPVLSDTGQLNRGINRMSIRFVAILLAALALGLSSPAMAQDGPKLTEEWLDGFPWRSIGPANMSGRVTDIEGIPRSE